MNNRRRRVVIALAIVAAAGAVVALAAAVRASTRPRFGTQTLAPAMQFPAAEAGSVRWDVGHSRLLLPNLVGNQTRSLDLSTMHSSRLPGEGMIIPVDAEGVLEVRGMPSCGVFPFVRRVATVRSRHSGATLYQVPLPWNVACHDHSWDFGRLPSPTWIFCDREREPNKLGIWVFRSDRCLRSSLSLSEPVSYVTSISFDPLTELATAVTARFVLAFPVGKNVEAIPPAVERFPRAGKYVDEVALSLPDDRGERWLAQTVSAFDYAGAPNVLHLWRIDREGAIRQRIRLASPPIRRQSQRFSGLRFSPVDQTLFLVRWDAGDGGHPMVYAWQKGRDFHLVGPGWAYDLQPKRNRVAVLTVEGPVRQITIYNTGKLSRGRE